MKRTGWKFVQLLVLVSLLFQYSPSIVYAIETMNSATEQEVSLASREENENLTEKAETTKEEVSSNNEDEVPANEFSSVEDETSEVLETNVEEDKAVEGVLQEFVEKVDFQSEWGNVDYTKGLTVGDSSQDICKSGLGGVVSWTMKRENLHFLIRSKDGKYAYSRVLNNGATCLTGIVPRQSDSVFYTLIGGSSGSASTIGKDYYNYWQFEFKSSFYDYYKEEASEPLKGKDLNDVMNWINYWTESNVSIVQMNAEEVYNYVTEKNTNVTYAPESKDFTQGISIGDWYQDIHVSSIAWTMRKDDLYFLIRSKDGKYAYSKELHNDGNFFSTPRNLDSVYYRIIGGSPGSASNMGKVTNTDWQFEFLPSFHTYYKDTLVNPLKNKDLNYVMNWINYWTESNISIVQMSAEEVYNYVTEKNTNIKYAPEHKDFTQGLSVGNSQQDINASYCSWTIKKDNLYFLIRSKDGKYAYSKELRNGEPWLTGMVPRNTDSVFYTLIGGSSGSANMIGKDYYNYWQFEFVPSFYTYYKDTRVQPLNNKDLNYVMNWINYWTESNVSIVEMENPEIEVAQKNKELLDWHFYKEGRTTKKNQYYNLNLTDAVTRLKFEVDNSSYTNQLTIYSSDNKVIYNYGTRTVTLDLPRGNYKVALTGITKETTFQITKSNFGNFDFSIDTNSERTQVYVNRELNQELTDLYAPYHSKTTPPTGVTVYNKLANLWKYDMGAHKSLDDLFGTNHLLDAPKLKEYGDFSGVGFSPFGSVTYAYSPIQYVGRGVYTSNNKLFRIEDEKKQRANERVLLADDLLFWYGVGILATYAASVTAITIANNQNSLDMTISLPSSFEHGKWKEAEESFGASGGSFVYGGKTYDVDDRTGSIRDRLTGEEFTDERIPESVKVSAAGATQTVKAEIAKTSGVKVEANYRWYTYKDLVEDELAGGHTIKRHVGIENEELKKRLTGEGGGNPIIFASRYYNVVSTLYAINLAQLENPGKFTNVVGRQKAKVTSLIPLGEGLHREGDGKFIRDLRLSENIIEQAPMSKGFKVITSYPTKKNLSSPLPD